MIARVLRSAWLPAALIAFSIGVFVALAARAKGDLRLVSAEIDPDLKRMPPGAAAPGAAIDPARHGHLVVKVSGVRSAEGKVSVAVYERGPLTSGEGILVAKTVPAAAGGVELAFDDVPQGVYAVTAYHDENGNGRLDFRGGANGPPAEGIGSSNAHGPPTGPPLFEDAKLALDREAVEVPLRLFYY